MKSQSSCILLSLLMAAAAACGDGKKPPAEPVAETPTAMVKPSETEKSPENAKPVKPVEIQLPATYAACVEEGKAAALKGDHAHARELFAQAAKLDKKQAEPHVELARSYIATNEKGNAIKSARKAVKLAPESSQAYNTLGRAELLRHSYDDAIEAFRQATELNADNVWAWNNLGFVQLTLKHYKDAVDALTEATSRKGAEGYMWNNLGLAYEQLDQLDEAREAFEAGAKLGSTEAKASRQRLEGVETIAVAPKANAPVDDVEQEHMDTIEPSPEDFEKDQLKTGEPDENENDADEPAPADAQTL